MKTNIFLYIIPFFCGTQLFAQTIQTRPLQEKSFAPHVTTQSMRVVEEQKKQNVPPPPAPTDLQKAVINIVVGDDGKDHDTYVMIKINDGNRRIAAFYGEDINGTFVGQSQGEYFPGDNETLPTQLYGSVPTGEIKQVGGLPLGVTREAALLDFKNNNGGSINIFISPTGHDTWKINSFSVTLFFNNDPGTPHKMTWNGFTLSQNSRSKDLEFDKNFNAIQ